MKPQFEEQYRLFEKDWWWFVGRHDLITKILSSLKYMDNMKVLEVGCSSGENSKLLTEPSNYYGVDISLNAIRAGSFDKNLLVGHAGALSFSDKTFEVVLFLDILEHLDDEKSALEEARRVLKDGGYLLILVPVFNFLWSGHDILNQHKRRYTKSRLASILTKNEFKIIRMSYWNFFLFLPVAVMRIVKKISTKRETADFVAIPGILNNLLLLNLLKIENNLIYNGVNLPVGVSMLCVCKKKY